MKYWLMKTEPEAFSIDDLKNKGTAPWDGVRAYPARSNMMKMKVGEQVLFYHSSTKPMGVVGIARVAKAAYPDFTAWNPKGHYFDARSTPDKPIWQMVDVEFVEKFPRLVTLEEIKADPGFAKMPLLNSFRLSVQPVDPADFERIKQLGHAPL